MSLSDAVTHTNQKKDDLPLSSVTIPCARAGTVSRDLQMFYLSHNHSCFLTGRRKGLKAEMFYGVILKLFCRAEISQALEMLLG